MTIPTELTIVLAVFGMLTLLLRIATIKPTANEKLALLGWAFLVCVLVAFTAIWPIVLVILAAVLVFYYLKYRHCLKLTSLIFKLHLSPADLPAFEHWILTFRRSKEMNQEAASKAIVNLRIADLRGQLPAESAKLIIEEFVENKIFWHGQTVFQNRTYLANIELHRFLSLYDGDNPMPTFTHCLHADMVRFLGSAEVIVFMSHGCRHIDLFDKMKGLLNATDVIAFPEGKADSVFLADLFRRIEDKKVLLVEPLLIDTSVDNAVEQIRLAKGVLAGFVIIFAASDIPLTQLKYFDDLRMISKEKEDQILPQIVVDLGRVA